MSKLGEINNIISILQECPTIEQAQEKMRENQLNQGIPFELIQTIHNLCHNKYSDGSLFSMLNEAEPNQRISQHGFNEQVYAQALAITKLACFFENNQHAEFHAYKLAIYLGNIKGFKEYLNAFTKEFPSSKQPIHDACLFTIPSDDNWDVKTWQSLCQKYLKEANFRKVGVIGNLTRIQEKLIQKGWKLGFEAEIEEKISKMESQIQDISVNIRELDGKIIELRKERINSNSPEIIESEIKEWTQQKKHETAEKNKLQSLLKILKPKEPKLIRDIDLDSLINTQLSLSYRFADQDMAAAKLFHHYGMREKDFLRYLELKGEIKDSDEHIPPILINGHEYNSSGYYIVKLNRDDPKGALLGEITACCQSLGNVGGKCAEHGMTNERGGFYILCKGKPPLDSKTKKIDTKKIPAKDIMAQCWAWRGDDDTLVLDSIESQPNIRKVEGNIDIINKMYYVLAGELIEKCSVDKVHIGTGGATPSGVGYESADPSKMLNYQGYADSSIQRVVADKSKPLYYQMICKSQQELLNILEKIELDELKKYNIQQLFNLAVYFNDIDVTQWCLNQGANLELKNEKGQTPLILAITNNSTKSIKTLVNLEANLNSRDGEGATVLQTAISGCGISIIELLLQKGVDVNIPGRFGRTPLMEAILHGRNDVFYKLLKEKIDVNQKSEGGRTALFFAVASGNKDLTSELIQLGANVNDDFDSFGNTPLLSALQGGSLDVLKILIDAQVDVNQEGKMCTPLEDAILARNFEVVQLLVQAGADIHHINEGGENSLYLAVVSENLQKIQYFIDLGLDVNIRNDNRQTPLGVAVDNNNIEAIELLCDAGADLTQTDTIGRPILLHAIFYNHTKSALKLIEKGVDYNLTKNDGTSALTLACALGNHAVFDKLIEMDVDVNYQESDGVTALIRAARNNHQNLVSKLLEKNALINPVDQNGKSALIHALEAENYDIASDLIRAGAKFDFGTKAGFNCFNKLIGYNKNDIVNLLLDSAFDVNDRGPAEMTPLMLTMLLESSMVNNLIARGADLNAQDKGGNTALHYGVIQQNLEMIKVLINAGASLDIINNKGTTIVDIAKKPTRNPDIRKLIEKALENEKLQAVKSLQSDLQQKQKDHKKSDAATLIKDKLTEPKDSKDKLKGG